MAKTYSHNFATSELLPNICTPLSAGVSIPWFRRQIYTWEPAAMESVLNYGAYSRFRYQPYNLVINSSTCPLDCSWFGPVDKIPLHIVEKHPELIQDKLETSIDLREDAYRTMLTVVNDIPFLAYLSYDCNLGSLTYDVRCFTKENIYYGMQVSANEDKKFGLIVQAVKCLPFNSTKESSLSFKVRDCMDALGGPGKVVVEFEPLYATAYLLVYNKCCACQLVPNIST